MRINQRQLFVIRHVSTGNCMSGTQCSTIRLYKWKDALRIVNKYRRYSAQRYNPLTRVIEQIIPPPAGDYEIVPVTLQVGPSVG